MFKKCFGAPKYTIDESGTVLDPHGHKVPQYMRKGTPHVTVLDQYWKKTHKSVARLVLSTFSPVDNPSEKSITFRDGDETNCQLSNLTWDCGFYIPTAIPGITTAHVTDFVPVYQRKDFEINLLGEVRNIHTKKKMTVNKSSGDRATVSLRNVNGTSSTVHIYRLLAETFLRHPRDCRHLVVNHIDGNPTNNNLSNLEWATYGENNRHAFETGLRPATGVIAKNVESGEIKEFPTLNAVARFLDTNPGNIHYHLKAQRVAKFTPVKGWMIKEADDTEDFPDPSNIVSKSTVMPVVVKELSTGKVKEFPSVIYAASHYGFPNSAIFACVTRDWIKPYNGYVFLPKPKTGRVRWPKYPPGLLQVFEEMNRNSKPVKVTNKVTGEVEYSAGSKYWLRKHPEITIDPAVLSRHLKKNSVFRDWEFEFIDLSKYRTE